MNIFYYSVHEILEYDEISMFKRLGHNVFCLGVNGPAGSVQSFRPSLVFNNTELNMYKQFYDAGGRFSYGDINETAIPEGFIKNFDLAVVMHDTNFIGKFWGSLRNTKVVWRTIGQGIEINENVMQRYRSDGLIIVRYSPMELYFSGSIGQDEIIRFYKRPDTYGKWSGLDEQVLMFCNSFKARYFSEFDDYLRITNNISAILGGVGNDEHNTAAGMVGWEEQQSLYRTSRVYLYAAGLDIPYTLNFIEAWMTGIPIVVYAPFNRRGRYFEIDLLVEDNVSGYVCRDIKSARNKILALLDDFDLAKRIGEAGRASAIRIFGDSYIEQQWVGFFKTLDLS